MPVQLDTSHTEMKPMDAETLKALRGSIAKWQLIADTDGVERGDCDLCEKFDDYGNDCEGCPVKQRTGKKRCWGSPYWEHEDGDVVSAKAELDFLKSLLPPEALTDEEKTHGR